MRGAHATIWHDGELTAVAASHPDAAELVDLEARTGPGPLLTAVRDGRPVSCRDALDEERWPWWAAEALRRGLRSSIHLVRKSSSVTLVVALFGVRPGALDADGVPMAEMLARFGSTVVANSIAYGQAQRTATQLKDSVAARAVTDQAKGILMHALGCDADEALRYLRRESQRRHVKVTEVAARVIATYVLLRLPEGPPACPAVRPCSGAGVAPSLRRFHRARDAGPGTAAARAEAPEMTGPTADGADRGARASANRDMMCSAIISGTSAVTISASGF